jgi:hypothetical protein
MALEAIPLKSSLVTDKCKYTEGTTLAKSLKEKALGKFAAVTAPSNKGLAGGILGKTALLVIPSKEVFKTG